MARVALVNDGDEHQTIYRCVVGDCSWIGTRHPHEGNPNAVNDALQEGIRHSAEAHPS